MGRSSIRLLRLHLLYLRASLPAGYARSLPRREPCDTPRSSKTRQDKMNNNNRGNEDYRDKALDKVEQMAGRKAGKNIDPQKYRKQNEKVTDKIRGMIEKFYGEEDAVEVLELRRGRDAIRLGMLCLLCEGILGRG